MTFAAVKSMAAALGQAATHAPQPMHAAASIASFCRLFRNENSIRIRGTASWRADEAASLNDAIESRAINDQVSDHREGRARHGSSVNESRP